MTVVQLPGFATEEAAMAWLAAYDVVRVVLFRGPDGMVRGSAVVRGLP